VFAVIQAQDRRLEHHGAVVVVGVVVVVWRFREFVGSP
jgi:hypothetical protein